MKRSSGKIQPGVAILLGIIAIGFLLVTSKGCWVPFSGNHYNSGWSNFFFGFLGFSGFIQLVLGVWVGVDAHKRGSNGYLWGLLVFVTPLIGLIVYLLWAGDILESFSQNSATQATASSPPPSESACSNCGEQLGSGFKVCPSCGTKTQCSNCGKAVQPNWKLCPYCTEPLRPGLGGE